MARLTRRVFLVSAAAFVGCRSQSRTDGALQGPELGVRQPSVGQSWSYAKRDAISRVVIDTQIDTVSVAVSYTHLTLPTKRIV